MIQKRTHLLSALPVTFSKSRREAMAEVSQLCVSGLVEAPKHSSELDAHFSGVVERESALLRRP